MIYVPLYQIRDELRTHYDTYQKCCSIPFVCQKLMKHPECFIENYYNPFPDQIDLLSDEDYMDCFIHSLYPLEQTAHAIKKHDDFSYLAESIFSKQILFRVFLHENFAKQNLHCHDYFEITYVFKGQCRIDFEKSSVQMSEGNVCIIAPNTLHEPFVLDPDSFVINLSMTAEAFQSALSTVLLRRDLVSFYLQKLLYQKDMPNYLLIPSNNSENIKNAVKHITYENRRNRSYSFSFCTSWLGVFMCSVLDNYQSDIRLYQDNTNSSQADHLMLLEYIQNNYRTVTLDSLATFFNYNKSYLSRLILQLTGESFVTITTRLKLQAGLSLLENTDFSLDQIAEVIGYNSGDYFSKAFKKAFHISAAKYRENHLLPNTFSQTT